MGQPKNMGKIKNGDAVHLISVSGSQEGNCLHSNMAEGAGLSFGSTDRSDLGWVLDMERTHKRKNIRGGDVIHLRPCGWGDGCSNDFYFHSNAPEGAMFSGGERRADLAWYIEGESRHIHDGDVVMMHAIGDAYDGSDRGPYMHSNGEEGGGFSFGGDAFEYGWQIQKIDDFSTSKCGGGKKVKNGSYIHLRSTSGPQEGSVLHSNMAEGAMLSYGSTDHGELGWRVIAGMRTLAKSDMAWTSCSKAWVLAPSCTPTPLRVAHSLVVTSAQISALFLKVVTRVTRSDTGRLSFSDALVTRTTDRTVGLACIPMAMRVVASPLVATTCSMAGSLNPTTDGTHHLMTGEVCAQDICLMYRGYRCIIYVPKYLEVNRKTPYP